MNGEEVFEKVSAEIDGVLKKYGYAYSEHTIGPFTIRRWESDHDVLEIKFRRLKDD